MSSRVKVLVLTGFGINCDLETAHAFKAVGGEPERVHANLLMQGKVSLNDYDILAIPGGFSFGDHLGSGKLLGNRLRFTLGEQLKEFVKAGKPVIGICNGFQVLVKTGLLPGHDEPELTPEASLTLNDSGRYEDRWVVMEADPQSPCIWTKGVERIEMPIRHGEGKFVLPNPDRLAEVVGNHQMVLRYVHPESKHGFFGVDEMLKYPWNPNGSMLNIAGVCDPTGMVLGLMPHPEAYHSEWLHPHWTDSKKPVAEEPPQLFPHISRDESDDSLSDGNGFETNGRTATAKKEAWHGAGLMLFRNAVEYAEKQLTS